MYEELSCLDRCFGGTTYIYVISAKKCYLYVLERFALQIASNVLHCSEISSLLYDCFVDPILIEKSVFVIIQPDLHE